jgi:hypothetical protein
MEFCATFEHGETFADYPLCLTYGLKHPARFGALQDIRPTTADDPSDPYRLVYRLFDSSPARQRYLKRQHDRRHPGQPVLFADMFTPPGVPEPKLRKPRTMRGRRVPINPAV